jgi:hypothetical protein
MKRLSTYLIAFIISLSVLFAEDIEIILGEGYENDLWFHFDNGIVKAEPKDNWDIAFQTGSKDAGIRINSQKGLLLWVVEGSHADSWDDPIDTTGMSANWQQWHNTSSKWSIGAFNLGLNGFETNGDFGWGEYNMATHSVSGNKVFVLKLSDNIYKKVMIEGLLHGTYSVLWADLDGNNEETMEIKKSDYGSKMFVYLDVINKKLIDREPPLESWSLIFGKYTAMIQMGLGQIVPYGVTGVRTNPNYRTAVVEGVSPSEANAPELNSDNYSSDIDRIGSDWKKLDHETFTYNIVEDLSYFVTSEMDDTPDPLINKILFKEFEGSNSGRLVFELNGSTSSVEIYDVSNQLVVYPNIVKPNSYINIEIMDQGSSGFISIKMFDQSGSALIDKRVAKGNSKDIISLEIPDCAIGLYYLSIQIDNKMFLDRIIVK